MKERKKPKLVGDWKDFWKWHSVRFGSLTLITNIAVEAWESLPLAFQAAVPSKWLLYGAIVFGVLGLVGRILDQGTGERDA